MISTSAGTEEAIEEPISTEVPVETILSTEVERILPVTPDFEQWIDLTLYPNPTTDYIYL